MIVVTAGVGHRVDSVFAGHYCLLQTIEQNFGLSQEGGSTGIGHCTGPKAVTRVCLGP